MSNLFVVAHDDLATANKVRDKLFELSEEHLVELEDAVVVERRDDGRIKPHQAVAAAQAKTAESQAKTTGSGTPAA